MTGLVLASLLLLQDLTGDTYGSGDLTPPTAALYRSLSSFDLTEVNLLEGDTLGFELSFSSLSNPLDLPNGFSLPIIEVYIADDAEGAVELLPGSGMQLPTGSSWHYAFRLSGDRAQVFAAQGDEVSELPSPPELSVNGATLRVQSDLPRARSVKTFVVVGSYSPFSATGWRDLSAEPSPWAFSSPEQTRPVIDLLADSDAAQRRAIRSGVLPVPRSATENRWNAWLVLAVLGAVTALGGFAGRFYSARTPKKRTPLKKEPPKQGVSNWFLDEPQPLPVSTRTPSLHDGVTRGAAPGVSRAVWLEFEAKTKDILTDINPADAFTYDYETDNLLPPRAKRRSSSSWQAEPQWKLDDLSLPEKPDEAATNPTALEPGAHDTSDKLVPTLPPTAAKRTKTVDEPLSGENVDLSDLAAHLLEKAKLPFKDER